MQKVLEFYKVLPFNYYESPQTHAEQIRENNAVLSQPGLDSILNTGGTVLDVGCGAGWLANNIAYHYHCEVTGIDFNPVAISRAKEVADLLKSETQFAVANLFTYQPPGPFDVVTSIGVLHHTDDCLGGLRRLCREMVKPHGHLYGGLYHLYGRKPFLDFFENLRKQDLGEEELLAEFKILHSSLVDDTHLRSWFRDQVLHPYETQHTLQEVVEVLDDEGLTLSGTSINKFEPFSTLENLFSLEKKLLELGETRLREKKYYPGFFTFLAKKE